MGFNNFHFLVNIIDPFFSKWTNWIICFSSDSKYLVIAGEKSWSFSSRILIHKWDIYTNQLVKDLVIRHKEIPLYLSFLDDGETIEVGSSHIKSYWNLNTTLEIKDKRQKLNLLSGIFDDQYFDYNVVRSSNGELIAQIGDWGIIDSTSFDSKSEKTITVYLSSSNIPKIPKFLECKYEIEKIYLTPDEKYLIAKNCGFGDNRGPYFELWETDTLEYVRGFHLEGSEYAPALCFTPDGQYLLISRTNRISWSDTQEISRIEIYDAHLNDKIGCFDEVKGMVSTIMFSPNSELLAFVMENEKTVRIYKNKSTMKLEE
ncbi:MAG: WD40 repeat domain-containing protein [Bacteroidetes bacterium]|nr:WD40 repeat domain-containing protein [Bacteroidota bacterium]